MSLILCVTVQPCQAKGIMAAGQLVPDDLVLDLLAERIRSPECARGFILDGYPRNQEQADAVSVLVFAVGNIRFLNMPVFLTHPLFMECSCIGLCISWISGVPTVRVQVAPKKDLHVFSAAYMHFVAIVLFCRRGLQP